MLILFWTLFALSSVSVQFHSTTKNLTITEQEIVDAGEFRYGACVLFEGKNKSIEKINDKVSENANFAYLKVINIETKFPNKYVIHVTEREEFFAVEHDGQVLICDHEFRVLKIETEYKSTSENAILLKGLNILNQSVSTGDFLNLEQAGIKNFHSAMLKNNRNLNEILGKFKEINLSSYQDQITKENYVSMKITTFAGRDYVINNIDFALAEKLQKLYAVETAIFNKTEEELSQIKVVKNEAGEYLAFDYAKELTDQDGNKIYSEDDAISLSYQILSNCYIKIDNLTLSEYIERTEKDIFYALIEK